MQLYCQKISQGHLATIGARMDSQKSENRTWKFSISGPFPIKFFELEFRINQTFVAKNRFFL